MIAPAGRSSWCRGLQRSCGTRPRPLQRNTYTPFFPWFLKQPAGLSNISSSFISSLGCLLNQNYTPHWQTTPTGTLRKGNNSCLQPKIILPLIVEVSEMSRRPVPVCRQYGTQWQGIANTTAWPQFLPNPPAKSPRMPADSIINAIQGISNVIFSYLVIPTSQTPAMWGW